MKLLSENSWLGLITFNVKDNNYSCCSVYIRSFVRSVVVSKYKADIPHLEREMY
jgi:hypothetical protein